MSALATFDVQKAIVAALKGFSPDIAGDRISDRPDPATPFPYIEVGETQVLQADVSGRTGADEYLTLHIWSRYKGKMEVRQIAAQVSSALHATSLSVPDMSSAYVFVRDLRIMTDPDGKTEHGIMDVRITYFGPQEN